MKLDGFETERLTRRVRKLGIELPPDKTDWWYHDLEFVGDPMDVTHYLPSAVKVGIRKLIREERRRNIDWWVNALGKLVPLVVGLAGLICTLIGYIAVTLLQVEDVRKLIFVDVGLWAEPHLWSAPLTPGRRNQFNVGLQQGIGKYIVADIDYFNKVTHNAHDFNVILNTPITFSISWNESKIDGISFRLNLAN